MKKILSFDELIPGSVICMDPPMAFGTAIVLEVDRVRRTALLVRPYAYCILGQSTLAADLRSDDCGGESVLGAEKYRLHEASIQEGYVLADATYLARDWHYEADEECDFSGL